MFKILVKDVDEFIKSQLILFASGSSKHFYITLHAAPGVKRYIIRETSTGKETGFIKRGEAIRFFNSL